MSAAERRIAGTGQLGDPKEPFAEVAVPACAEAWGVPTLEDDPERYLRAAMTNGTTPNGICAVKVMWDDVERPPWGMLRDPTVARTRWR